MAERIVALDGLRGGAALFVFSYHLQIAFGTIPSLSRGYLMVDLFFLLSGFVLGRAADHKLAEGSGALPFLVSRVLRIWPIMAVGVLVGLVSALTRMWPDHFNLHGLRTLAQLLISGFLLVPYLGRDRSGALFPLNGPHWSLMFELIANVFHAGMLWRLRNSHLAVMVGIWALLLAASSYAKGGVLAGPFWGNWYYGIPRIGFSYSLGMLMARLWVSGVPGKARPTWLSAQILPHAATIAIVFSPISNWVEDLFLVILVFPLSLWLAAASRIPKQSAAWLSGIGALSYPLYAIHGPIVKFAATHNAGLLMLPLVAAACLVLAAALAVLLERGSWPRRRRALAEALLNRRSAGKAIG